MSRVAIIGSGVLAQHIAHYLESENEIAGFYDDFRQAGEQTRHGKILGDLNAIGRDFDHGCFHQLVIGIGYSHMAFRKQAFERFAGSIPFKTYIHPSCYLDPSCKVGSGVIALPGCIFDMEVELGDNVFLNPGCSVSHNSYIGSHTFFGPAVKLAGFVQVNEGCFIGVGTTIIDNISICANSRTGGGAVIIKSIPSPGLYAGVPARQIRTFMDSTL